VKAFTGAALSWTVRETVVEVVLHRPPANEIGTSTLDELEKLAALLTSFERNCRALIVSSSLPAGFSAGADLRELWAGMRATPQNEWSGRVRDFLNRVHRAFNRLDETSLVTIAACHGIVFGGGFELALTCDIIIADALARFCFPELRLGLVPGFGGVARLARDAGNALVRDLLFTGRSLGAARAHQAGIVSQIVAEGRALEIARTTAAQVGKLDPGAAGAAKRLAKRVPREALEREIDEFVELFTRPVVSEALQRFVESKDPMPYLPNR
jgi:enoyl-CoA hydratase/carnithine racemase